MSPQMIQKLPAITLLEGMFPELSTNQLKVCVFYAMGVPYDAIAQNCRLSPETVRTYLKRSLKNLNLEGYDALRSAWICPYISRHLLSLNPLQARCRRYSRGER